MKAIKCDYCEAAWPEDNYHLVHVETRLPSVDTEQDFCGWECLAKYAAERESKAVAGVSHNSGDGS